MSPEHGIREAGGPPEALVTSLLDGPSRVAWFEWHEQVDSTNVVAVEAAQRGAPEIGVVTADLQHAGRGRLGRVWQAPAGTSLLVSFLLRPPVDQAALPLLPLLAGVTLAEVTAAHVPGCDVALKWPNDLLIDGRKAAGILVERAARDATIVGIGVNTDWRDTDRPASLAEATSLSEAAGRGVDRWKMLAGLVGVLDRGYAEWLAAPAAVVDRYRPWCATLGRRVRITTGDGRQTEGIAVAIGESGALEVDAGGKRLHITAGDVAYLRPASPALAEEGEAPYA